MQQHVRSAVALGTKVKITVFHTDATIANQAIDAAALESICRSFCKRSFAKQIRD